MACDFAERIAMSEQPVCCRSEVSDGHAPKGRLPERCQASDMTAPKAPLRRPTAAT